MTSLLITTVCISLYSSVRKFSWIYEKLMHVIKDYYHAFSNENGVRIFTMLSQGYAKGIRYITVYYATIIL